MIVVQLLHSLFFIFVSYILYLKYNNYRSIKTCYIYSGVFSGLLLLVYNYTFNGLSNKLYFILLIFSLSIVAIQFMRNFLNVFGRDHELEQQKQLKEKFPSVQDFAFNKLLIGLTCTYQLLLIWIPEIFQRMTDSH